MKNNRAIWLSLGLSAALIAAGIWFLSDGLYLFGGRWGGWHMPRHGMMGHGGMGLVMGIFWLVVLGALGLLIAGLFPGRRGDNAAAHDVPDALEILKRRYARGEIDEVSFKSMRRELGQG